MADGYRPDAVIEPISRRYYNADWASSRRGGDTLRSIRQEKTVALCGTSLGAYQR